jgi:predicted nucleic acid-binding protein
VSAYLLDTNVLSELRKERRADQKVVAWYLSVSKSDCFISVLAVGEIRKGIARLRRRDPIQSTILERWLQKIEASYAGNMLPISSNIADRWGRLMAIRPIPIIDGLLAATALEHSLTLVTRNTSDVQHTGVSLLNPF